MLSSKNSKLDIVSEAKELAVLERQLEMRSDMYERKKLIINETIASQDIKKIIQTVSEIQELANFARSK